MAEKLRNFEPFFFFLINFIRVIFEAGNETREKFWSDFGAEQKWRAELFVALIAKDFYSALFPCTIIKS